MKPMFHTQEAMIVNFDLKTERSVRWMQEHWIAHRPEQDWIVITATNTVLDESVLERLEAQGDPIGEYTFRGSDVIRESRFPVVYSGWDFTGELRQRTGAFVYRFADSEGAEQEILVISVYAGDHNTTVDLACIPRSFMPTWSRFVQKCNKHRSPRNRVTIIGGNQRLYKPRVDWADIILPDELKADIFEDVVSFFARGPQVYGRLGLNPFRKILLAGVPGTGKTMICNGLAKWALEQDYTVLYVSGADANGANFFKIQQALATAENSEQATLIILEELDAFLHHEQKALILNVLDGIESFENRFGTLLVATTNYPEAIDERVLKRPGRLDRIYVIPPVQDEFIAEDMLRQYLGNMWRDEHRTLAAKLVNYPGAFIREVAVYALTRAVADEADQLPLALLCDSFDRLKSQIKARDSLIAQHSTNGRHNEFGFARNMAEKLREL